ncbi:ATP-binding protein [Paenibacillus sp. TAB 01]|uniref:ATP-binding protein n=1 Tax=Paenibacillus sp. TAB 01 TaxID=3368988 RepID=UPI003752ADBD
MTERFYQVNPEGEGTGLGLAICRELIELHGGSLVIDSTPDAGTSVTVRLPLPAAAPSELAAPDKA